jgi:hypothetical protein
MPKPAIEGVPATGTRATTGAVNAIAALAAAGCATTARPVLRPPAKLRSG